MLPILDSRGAIGAPKRMVAINFPLGFHDSRDYALSSYLKSAAALRNDFTVISGTSHPDVDGGHSADLSHCGATPGFNTISLDQFIAHRLGDSTRYASLKATTVCLGQQTESRFPMKVRRPLYLQNCFLVELQRKLLSRKFT